MGSSREIDLLWEKIRNTVDELVGFLEGLDGDSLNWRPLDNASSLYVLAVHAMGNSWSNFLNVLCGLSVARPGLARYSHGGESGPQPPLPSASPPAERGERGNGDYAQVSRGRGPPECGPEQGWVTEVWTGASCHYAGGHGGGRS